MPPVDESVCTEVERRMRGCNQRRAIFKGDYLLIRGDWRVSGGLRGGKGRGLVDDDLNEFPIPEHSCVLFLYNGAVSHHPPELPETLLQAVVIVGVDRDLMIFDLLNSTVTVIRR